MIILDTNVISEEMRAAPDPKVHDWLRGQDPARLFTTAVTEAELLYGVAALADGKRKRDLATAAERIMALFGGRILPFDRAAAAAIPSLLLARKQVGRPIGSFDAQIAAIAISRGMALATRDIRDFADCGITLVNPWD